MNEQYIKAEIIRTPWTADQWAKGILGMLLSIALITLFVWWTIASWFPEFGLTYWQLILPVFTFRFLIGRGQIGRQIEKGEPLKPF